MEGTKAKRSRNKTWGGSSQRYQTMDEIPVIPSAMDDAFITPPAVGDIPVIPPARDDVLLIPPARNDTPFIPPARDDTLPIPPARDDVLLIPPSSLIPPLVGHVKIRNETGTFARPSNKGKKISIVVQRPVAESKQSFDSQEDQETVHNPHDTDTTDTKAQTPEDTLQDELRDFVMNTLPRFGGGVKKLATDTLPSNIYLHFLLRLPYFYLSRVDRLFTDVNLSMLQIVQVATEISIVGDDPQTVLSEDLENDPERKKALVVYLRLQTRWKNLMDALMEEWKALNVIGVLLLGAIMTMFQIDGAAQDPVTRYLAFCSLICSLLSLLHGCMFIVQFSTMRRASRAAEWALEAQKDINFFWNVWVMLSMPLFWLTWSIITFIICIITFMWRSRVQLPDDFVFSAPRHLELGARIFISCVLGIGMIYTYLILYTLAQYGSKMDEKWNERIDKYVEVSKKKAKKIQWQSRLSREIEPSPPKNSPKPKVLHKEKKPEVVKTEDRQKTPADAPSEERNGEVGDSDRRERSSESHVQERQQQPPDTPREIRRRDRQQINPRSQFPEGAKHQAESINGQQPQDFQPAAKAQDEVLEGTKGTLGNTSRQRSRESRENGRQGIPEAGRQQGVQDRAKEQLEGSRERQRSQRRSSERRGTRSPRPVVESPRSALQSPHSVLEGTRSSLRQ